MRETYPFFVDALLVKGSKGGAIVAVGKVGKVTLPNIHDGVLSGCE